MNKVTIVIPNWNGKKYLKKCLDSLMCQSIGQVPGDCSGQWIRGWKSGTFKKGVSMGSADLYGSELWLLQGS